VAELVLFRILTSIVSSVAVSSKQMLDAFDGSILDLFSQLDDLILSVH
jgi:hypothetical protein